jgi:hypothetical protein
MEYTLHVSKLDKHFEIDQIDVICAERYPHHNPMGWVYWNSTGTPLETPLAWCDGMTRNL